LSNVTLSSLVHAIGTSQVTAFFLVLARIAPLFLLAPLFSSKMIPARVRSVVGVALALGLTGVAMHGQPIPSSPMAVAGLILANAVVGLAFSFAIGCVMFAIEMTGALSDGFSGFSYGSQIDPLSGNQGGVLTNLYGLVGTMIFIAIGGDAWTLRGLSRTFTLVPLTRGPQIASLVGGAENASATLFTAAIEVAAPLLLALVITDVGFGLVSRVVPQLNVFAVGFPVKVAVSLLVVAVSLPFLGSWMTSQIEDSLAVGLHSLGIA
jgi:flagellar biosynthetic protein FliR